MLFWANKSHNNRMKGDIGAGGRETSIEENVNKNNICQARAAGVFFFFLRIWDWNILITVLRL